MACFMEKNTIQLITQWRKKNQIITGGFRYIKQNTYLNIIIYNIDSMVKYNWISIYLCKLANMGLTMTFLGMFIATKEE